MTADEAMTLDERTKYLRMMQVRYHEAVDKVRKSALLDEMVAVAGLNRNYLIQKLRHRIRRQQRSRERGKTYGPEVDAALDQIWRTQDCICAERLIGYLLETADNLARNGRLRLDPHLRQQLEAISVSTVRRHLPPARSSVRQGTSRPTPNTLQRQIPIHRIPWNTAEPGHCEVDLVHHGGSEPRGQYGYTVQMIDVATGWSGRRAILGRSYVVVADALYALFEQFPFPILELHVDNGSEFLNQHVLRFLKQFYSAVAITRSAPGRPNDNRFVEQKNATLVRAFVDDRPLNTVAQIRFLNALYDTMATYHNLWQPMLHQVAKERIAASASLPAHTRRTHDRARPPLERLLDSHILTSSAQQALRARQQAVDLLALHDDIHRRLAHLFTYACADAHDTQNAFEVLAHPELFPAAFAALDVVPVSRYQDTLPSVSACHYNSETTSQKGERSLPLT